MKTFVLEGIVTALSSITHNGGEKNGTVTQLRREKFVQPNGRPIEIPVISGNSIRGKLRDIAAMDILTFAGTKIKVDADSFNLLFTGGSLESTGDSGINVEKVRQMRRDMPMLSVLGGSVGNVILPGKVEIGKLIPIAKETLHLIPEQYHNAYTEEPKSIWEYCQLEMYTRKDDAKDEVKKEFLQEADGKKKERPVQMKYDTETIAAGTKFYWRICLKDTTDIETGAFLQTLNTWAEQNSQVGGNGRVGHGALNLEIKETKVIDSELDFQNKDFVKYIDRYKEKKKDVSAYFEKGISKSLFE